MTSYLGEPEGGPPDEKDKYVRLKIRVWFGISYNLLEVIFLYGLKRHTQASSMPTLPTWTNCMVLEHMSARSDAIR